MRMNSKPAGRSPGFRTSHQGDSAMRYQQSPIALAIARETSIRNFVRASVPPAIDARGNAEYTKHFAWFGDVAVSITWTPKKGPDRKPVIDKDGKAVMEQRAKLEAHEPGSRARALPLGTSFNFANLHHIRANEAANSRELKKLVLQSLYGDTWAVRSDVKYEDPPKGHLVTLIEDDEAQVVKAGVADTDAPKRKGRRHRTKSFAEVVVEDTTTH